MKVDPSFASAAFRKPAASFAQPGQTFEQFLASTQGALDANQADASGEAEFFGHASLTTNLAVAYKPDSGALGLSPGTLTAADRIARTAPAPRNFGMVDHGQSSVSRSDNAQSLEPAAQSGRVGVQSEQAQTRAAGAVFDEVARDPVSTLGRPNDAASVGKDGVLFQLPPPPTVPPSQTVSEQIVLASLGPQLQGQASAGQFRTSSKSQSEAANLSLVGDNGGLKVVVAAAGLQSDEQLRFKSIAAGLLAEHGETLSHFVINGVSYGVQAENSENS